MRFFAVLVSALCLTACAKSFDDEYAETEKQISQDAAAFDAEMERAATKQEQSK